MLIGVHKFWGPLLFTPPLRSGPKPFPKRNLSQGRLSGRDRAVSNTAAAHFAAAAGEPLKDGAITCLSRFRGISRRRDHPHRGAETEEGGLQRLQGVPTGVQVVAQLLDALPSGGA